MKSIIGIFVVTIVAACSASGQNSLQTLRQELLASPQTETSPAFAPPENLAQPHRKSQPLAIVYSLLLPGMGELYAEDFNGGRYSLVAEGALWLTYASFRQYGTWLQTDARDYASSHAGVSQNGKDDQFFVNIGNFDNVYDYNDKKLRDRDISDVYDPAQGYSWNWDSDASRQRFRALRISSDKVFNNSRFVIGAIVVNHIVSALNAARLVRHFNKNTEESFGFWQVEPNLVNGTGRLDGMQLKYTYRF